MRITLILFCFFLNLYHNNTLTISVGEELSSSHNSGYLDLLISKNTAKNTALPQLSALQLAFEGYQAMVSKGTISENAPLTIIDYSLPSTQKRLWVIAPASGEIIFHEYVSHGKNSGDLHAEKFSNAPSSFQSSLGFFVTAETYQGKHGYSLRLDGIEPGINDKARERAIVIHGAAYANADFIDKTGRLGRSLGCPALPTDTASKFINLVKEKSCLFIFANDPVYLEVSKVLKG